MLTGVRPFPGTDFMSVASNIIHSDPIKFADGNIDLDPKFEPVLRKGLSKEQSQRYSSCLEYVREIGKQFDIPIDQSGVLGFRIGMTLQDLYPKKKDTPTPAKNKTVDSDVAATMMGRAVPDVKKPADTKESKSPPSVPTQSGQSVQEGGGRGIAIFVGAIFLLLVAGGSYYLLQDGKDSEEEVASNTESDATSSQVKEVSPVQTSLTASQAAIAPTGEITPGCGLGTGCSTASIGVSSVTASILAKETPPTEAVTLKSENPEIAVTPEFAQSGVDAALLTKLFSPSTTSEQLIELIPTVGQLPYEQSGPVLLKIVSHPDFKVRIAVLKVFTSSEKFRTREVFRTIVEKLDDSEFLVRGFSAKFLASLKSEAAKKILSDRLKVETHPTVRKVIENALAG
jgi:hypothetical protein